MLHVRTGRVERQAMAALLRAIPDWLAARDPGLARLQLATRGTAAVLLTTLVAMGVGGLLHSPVFTFASGITYALMAPFLTREPTLRQRVISVGLLVLPAMAATVLTAVLHGYGPLGDSFFLVLVFLCFLLHPLHPRLIGMGLVAVVVTYIGLFLELPPSTLPTQLLGIALAWPMTAFACFVLVPVNPARTLRLAVRSVRWRAAQALRAGALGGDARRLQRDLVRLNEATLAADDQLALLQPLGREAVRALLIALELTTARLLNVLREEAGGVRQARRLALHGRRLRQGREYHMDPALADPGTVRGLLVQLGHVVHGLGVAAGGMRSAVVSPRPATVAPGRLAWRIAGRVTLASALAMAGGMALSPQRWFWAVITVYLVFLTTRSRGEAITKGAQRLAGTLFGIASGLVLATAVAGDPGLEAGALLLSVFGMYYWITTSYTAGIFCVTVMLGLIYGMLGASLETLLVLRLEETAIGAAAAVFVAAFVLPQRTRDQVMLSGRGVVTALVAVLAACRAAMAGEGVGAGPLERMRAVDRQVADLRVAIAPLTVGRSVLRRTVLERPVPALLDCVHWARVLAVESQGGVAPGWAVAAVAVIERRLEGVLAGEMMAGGVVVEAGALGEALLRLDEAVGLLGERLAIGALEGFGVS